MQRIYLDTKFYRDTALIKDAEIIHRLTSVLRVKAGEECRVFDTKGSEYLAKITGLDKNQVSLEFLKTISNKNEAAVRLNLYPSLFKKPRFEWMLEKCTELGVADFYPISTERSVIQEHGGPNTAERWNKIIISASEQSERTHIPFVHQTQSLKGALQSAVGKILVAAERSASTEIWPILSAEDQASLFIGPEGGWSIEEKRVFAEAGATQLSFGKRILRAETACIAGTALLLTNK